MPATFTPVTGTIRCGKEHNVFGDPYDFACTVQLIGDVAYISAALGEANQYNIKSILPVLRGIGATRVVFTRHRNGKVRKKEYSIVPGASGT